MSRLTTSATWADPLGSWLRAMHLAGAAQPRRSHWEAALRLAASAGIAESAASITPQAGFCGLWSALSLQLQDALISGYVVFFGCLMCAFAVGASHEGLRLWFGFLHTPHGQIGFLLVAGNLTWGLGTLGAVAAALTNLHAAYSWFTARDTNPALDTIAARDDIIGGRLRPETRDAAEIEGDAAEVAAKIELSGRRDSTDHLETPGRGAHAAAGGTEGGTAYNGWIADADGARPLGDVKRSVGGR